MTVVAQLSGIVKSYGGERALDGVDLQLKAGEVHALLGPNGSGKSTLIGALGGAVRPDEGEIQLEGVAVDHLTPAASRERGVAVIYQHFSLAESLTVTENVFLGRELKTGPFIARGRQRRAVAELLEQFGLRLTPDLTVGQLSLGDRQVVEIMKALLSSPSVLILDEPTTALSMAETEVLLSQIRSLADAGLAIAFTSHLLPDVLAIADRVTVLRDGRVYRHGPISEFDQANLVEAIAPRGSHTVTFLPPRETPCLRLRQTSVGGVGPIDLTVRDGEVVALFGLLGCGSSELLDGLVGARGRLPTGVELHGAAYRARNPASALGAGIALVPSDRTTNGICGELPALENVLLGHLRPAAWHGLLRRRRVDREIFRRVAERLSLLPPRSALAAAAFSGGSQQKLVLARWLNELSDVDVLLLDEPTQGVDVGARSEIHALIRDFVAKPGRCVLMAASEAEEVIAVADRAIVLAAGRGVGEVLRGPDMELSLIALAHQRPLGAAS